MIDLAGVASLFLEASKEWREPKVAYMRHTWDIEEEPAYLRLQERGHKVVWASESKLRKKSREGWHLVTERDSIGRPTIFMTWDKELVLLYKA